MSSVEIGARLRTVRGDLSQREFAERLSTSSGRISEVEGGKTIPGGEFLLRLHQGFGTDIVWLLTGVHAATHAVPDQAADIQELVDQFTKLPPEDQAAVRRTVDALVAAAVNRGDAIGIRRKGDRGSSAQVFHGPVGQAAAGNVVNEGRVYIKQKGSK